MFGVRQRVSERGTICEKSLLKRHTNHPRTHQFRELINRRWILKHHCLCVRAFLLSSVFSVSAMRCDPNGRTERRSPHSLTHTHATNIPGQRHRHHHRYLSFRSHTLYSPRGGFFLRWGNELEHDGRDSFNGPAQSKGKNDGKERIKWTTDLIEGYIM